MTLSNILREPKKELTETAVGLAAVCGILAAIATPSVGFHFLGGYDWGPSCLIEIGVATIAGVLALILHFCHGLGEDIIEERRNARREKEYRQRAREEYTKIQEFNNVVGYK